MFQLRFARPSSLGRLSATSQSKSVPPAKGVELFDTEAARKWALQKLENGLDSYTSGLLLCDKDEWIGLWIGEAQLWASNDEVKIPSLLLGKLSKSSLQVSQAIPVRVVDRLGYRTFCSAEEAHHGYFQAYLNSTIYWDPFTE